MLLAIKGRLAIRFLPVWLRRLRPAVPSGRSYRPALAALVLVALLSAGGLLLSSVAALTGDQGRVAAPGNSPSHETPAATGVLPSGRNMDSRASLAIDLPSTDVPGAGPASSPVRRAPADAAAPLTVIGDSVALGAALQLTGALGTVEVDARVGRQATELIEVLRARKTAGTLSSVVLLHIGNSGAMTREQLDEMLQVLFDFPTILLVNLHVARPWEGPNNAILADAADRYPNVVLVDWAAASANRPELFSDDEGHLSTLGATVYTDVIVQELSTLDLVSVTVEASSRAGPSPPGEPRPRDE